MACRVVFLCFCFVLVSILGTASQADGAGRSLLKDATEAAEQLSVRIREVTQHVTQAHILQAVLDGPAFGAQNHTSAVSAGLLSQQRRLAAERLLSAAPSLLKLRDATAEAQQPHSDVAVPSPRRQATGASQQPADLVQALRRDGVDADTLSAAGVLREAGLDADVQSLDSTALPPTDSPWSVAGHEASVAGSVVTMPQYCLRIGTPSFGPAYSSPLARDNIAEGLLGGLAPRADEGQYPCVTRNGKQEQQSLDSTLNILCFTRRNARVITCGSKAELIDIVRFLNASATLDGTMRGLLSAPLTPHNTLASIVLWQRIAHADMGVERSFPGMVWRETSLDPYERYDSRLQPWFWAAASAPRALVVVLDTGAAMDEWDRHDLALRLVTAVFRSVGPADLIGLVIATDDQPLVFGCNFSAVSAPAGASAQRLCATKNQTLDWMVQGAEAALSNASYGLCNLGQGLSSALQLLQNEASAWENSIASPGDNGAGARGAVDLGLPRPEVLLVTSAHGWAPSESIRKQAAATASGTAIHGVSVGALGSGYERRWLRELACGSGGALSHVSYRYIWQQVVGGWYRLAERNLSLEGSDRLVSVSALRLSASHALPVITLSSPYRGADSKLSGVVSIDVSPGPVFAQLSRNLSVSMGISSWEDHGAYFEMWAVDTSGIVLAHPALPHESRDFTHLRDLEGRRVHEDVFRLWRGREQQQDDACLGPLDLTYRRIEETGGKLRWRVGSTLSRVAVLMKVDSLVEHLDVLLILVFTGNAASFQRAAGAVQAECPGMILSKTHPGLPVFERSASSLVHHATLNVPSMDTGVVAGAGIAEDFYGGLDITVVSSVYHVSSRGMKDAWVQQVSTPSPSARSDLESLRSWLLHVNLTSAGFMAAPVSSSLGARYTPRAVRGILTSSQLDEPWKQAWAFRQQPTSPSSMRGNASNQSNQSSNTTTGGWAFEPISRDSGGSNTFLSLWRFVSVTLESGIFRIFPGCSQLQSGVDWTQSESYIRSIEAPGATIAAVAGPYAHPIDGKTTVSLGTVVTEADGFSSRIEGVVAVDFNLADFVKGSLGTLKECENPRWCMLLDQHASIVASSHSSAEATIAGKFLGEVEPLLAKKLGEDGLLHAVEVPVRFASGTKGKVLTSIELSVLAAGRSIESASSLKCRERMLFALQPVAGTNMILVVAEDSSGPTDCQAEVSPVTRDELALNLTAAASSPCQNDSFSQCRATRSSACNSCFVTVPSTPDGIMKVAGDTVIGSDGSQWVREVHAVQDGVGEDECSTVTPTLVRAHDGTAGDSDTCVWWRRRAGWC